MPVTDHSKRLLAKDRLRKSGANRRKQGCADACASCLRRIGRVRLEQLASVPDCRPDRDQSVIKMQSMPKRRGCPAAMESLDGASKRSICRQDIAAKDLPGRSCICNFSFPLDCPTLPGMNCGARRAVLDRLSRCPRIRKIQSAGNDDAEHG